MFPIALARVTFTLSDDKFLLFNPDNLMASSHAKNANCTDLSSV